MGKNSITPCVETWCLYWKVTQRELKSLGAQWSDVGQSVHGVRLGRDPHSGCNNNGGHLL